MGIKDLMGKVRGWIDDEEPEKPSEKSRGPSRWEEFLMALARGIEEVMEAELFTPPGGPTYIPREYVVFLSKDDDGEWQGEKRQGLERGLHTVISERARELVKGGELQTRTLTVELRVDPSLEKGKFRVLPVWDSKPEVTEVKPRQSAPSAPPPKAPLPQLPETTMPLASRDDLHEAPTIVKPRQSAPLETDDEATRIRPRAPLFSVAVSRDGALPFTRGLHKNVVSIGRGAQEDVRLEGDMEVSRSHMKLELAADGKFFVTCLGRNSITVGSREVVTDERAEVAPGESIQLCGFSLRIEKA